MSRRAESLCRRRQRDGDQRWREPHLDDSGRGSVRCRRDDPEALVTLGRLAAQRDLLALVLDTLVPAGEAFPESGALALDHVLAMAAASSEIESLLSRALEAIESSVRAGNIRAFSELGAAQREDLLRRVERSVPEPFEGLLLVSEPQSSPHYTAIRLVERVLARAFGEGWDVRAQAPIALDDASEPEPDVAVVRGAPRDYSTSHPAHPVLVVEVAASSLDFDREHKASLYARARCPEYWIVNLLDRVLEVQREPTPEPSAPYGWDYAVVDVLSPADQVSTLGAPAIQIAVGDLLP